MPILLVQSTFNRPPLCFPVQASSTCRSFDIRTRGGRDLAAAGKAGRESDHLTGVSESGPEPSRWPGIRSNSNASLRIAAETTTKSANRDGLGSEGRRLAGVSGRRRLDSKMAASTAVASPVLFKLDSIANDVPVGANTSGLSGRVERRNNAFIVIGHRGCGKNNPLSIGDVPGTRLSVRENTIRSFNLAASNGADYTEFDVQVTKDGHPVIFHDDLILSSEGQASPIGDLTLQEFLAYGPQKDGKSGKKMMRKLLDGTMTAWSSTLEDSLCTLKEVFELVEPSLGFNVEVKFHETEETPEFELRRVISAILADVEKYSKGRLIIFSTFHPTAAIILRQEQNTFPVFFLTDGGEFIYDDFRRNSLEAAIDVCTQNGLQGVVTEVLAILRNPQMASQVKNAGLSLFTYGDVNNVAEALVQQYSLNVDGVIVDCVREIVTASRTLHALLNFVQPDWSQILQPPSRASQLTKLV